MKTQFEFETANQLGFQPGSPGPKAAMLTIELHSSDKKKSVWSTKELKKQKIFFLEKVLNAIAHMMLKSRILNY